MNTIIAYRHADLLFDQPQLWDSLAGGVPFRGTAWLQAWWQQFGANADVLLIAVLDENKAICGILPLQRAGRRGWQTLAGGKICSDHVSLLARPENQHEVAAAIAEFLAENADDPDLGWDRLLFDGIVAGDPAMNMLLNELQRCEAAVRLTSRMNLWFTPCQPDWDSHLMLFSRQSRRKKREAIRQLELGELAIRFAEDEDTVTATIQKLILLHQRHWQSAGEAGTYAADGMESFILNAALNARACGQLFLPTVVHIDPVTQAEKIIAAQLFFVGHDRRLYCYSTGVDYEYANLAPGTLLTAFVLKHAHECGYRGVDFMRGDEEYKRRMKAEPLPLMEAEVWAPTLRGRVMTIVSDTVFRGKQLVRSWRKRPLVRTPSLPEAFADHFNPFLPSPIATSSLSCNADPSSVANENEDDESELPVILSFTMARQSCCATSLHSREP